MKRGIIPAIILPLVIVAVYIWSQDVDEGILPKNGIKGGKNTVVFLGDSVTAGYGVNSDEAFPYLINDYWRKNGISLRAVNRGISGDTTNGVLYRLDEVLTQDVYMVFLEIGVNDAFRLKEVPEIKSNLITIINRIKSKDIKVVVASMDLPHSNYSADPDYVKSFAAIYEEVGSECSVPVMPSLVKENEMKWEMWLEDGIHPSPKGHKVLAVNVLEFLNNDWILKDE